MSEPCPISQLFTAAQIATALKVAKKTVLQRWLKSGPIGLVMVKGQQANAWSLEALPERIRVRLAEEASRQGYRTVEEMILNPKIAWEPPIPLAEIAEECLQQAVKLRDALRPMLARKNETITEGEFNEQGARQYQAVFGHAVSARYWRELFDRVIERDRGFNNFERIEIFLPARVTPKENDSEADPVFDPSTHQFAQLIATFADPTRLEPHEEELLWARVFDHYERRGFFGEDKGALKSVFVAFLATQPPFIRSGWEGVRKQFERKYKRAVASGFKPVKDLRHEKSGRFRTPRFAEDDLNLIKAKAVLQCGGRVSQAFRELHDTEALSPEILSYYSSRPNKSYVPEKVREAVKHDIAACEDIHHGPRRARLNGPSLERDWSGVYAGDWHCQDDVTWPVYWCETDKAGKISVRQGQCLIDIDARSLRVLGFVMLSSASYDSLAIRSLNTRVFEEHGLPRRGFYFEGGIWESSKLIKGAKFDASADVVDMNYAETGLRGLGLQFVHSRLPRSKPVELVISLLQNRMEGFLGYRGRNFTVEKFEQVEKDKLAVEAGRVPSEGRFFTKEQFAAELEKIVRQYNAEPQEGKMLAGLSPDQAWTELQDQADPPIKFDARCRHLMAYHRKPVTVTRNGVCIRIGKRAFRYYDEETGKLQGREMLAWFNPEDTDYLVLTEKDHSSPRVIELVPDVPAMTATNDEIKKALQRANSHLKPAKALYRVLKSTLPVPHRANVVDRTTADLGAVITEQRRSIETHRRTENSRAARIEELKRELGMESMDIEPTEENEAALMEARAAHRAATATEARR